MSIKITNADIDSVIKHILENYEFENLLEFDVNDIANNIKKSTNDSQRQLDTHRDVNKNINVVSKSNVSGNNTQSNKINSPTTNLTDTKPIQKPKINNPTLNKRQLQIYNIKLRLGKLELNDIIRRFIQSTHDFDINVTKNSTDVDKIKSYLSSAQGNLVALMGALKSMESEYKSLETLLNMEK